MFWLPLWCKCHDLLSSSRSYDRDFPSARRVTAVLRASVCRVILGGPNLPWGRSSTVKVQNIKESSTSLQAWASCRSLWNWWLWKTDRTPWFHLGSNFYFWENNWLNRMCGYTWYIFPQMSLSLQGMYLDQRSRKSTMVPALAMTWFRVNRLWSSEMKLSGSTKNAFLSENRWRGKRAWKDGNARYALYCGILKTESHALLTIFGSSVWWLALRKYLLVELDTYI